MSLLVYFKVKDAVAAIHHVSSYEDRIYEDVQLSARRFLASKKLDAILTDRNEISDAVKQDVKEAAAGYGVEIMRADVKDLVFPGNLREIMNKVLETERRAEAQLIEAQKKAEALRIKRHAENEAEMQRIKAEKEKVQLQLETAQLQLQSRLKMEQAEAELLKQIPEVLTTLQLKMLKEMAARGAKFYINFSHSDLSKIFPTETT